MKERDVSQLLTDHYDRLVYPPQPPSRLLESVKDQAKYLFALTTNRAKALVHTTEQKP